jgi:hypothetical protein
MPAHSAKLSLYFRHCPVADIVCPLFYLESTRSLPLFAVQSLFHIQRTRDDLIAPLRFDSKPNDPVARLRYIQWKRTKPVEPLRDPYISAILIALAQQQRRRRPNQPVYIVLLLSALTWDDPVCLRGRHGHRVP